VPLWFFYLRVLCAFVVNPLRVLRAFVVNPLRVLCAFVVQSYPPSPITLPNHN